MSEANADASERLRIGEIARGARVSTRMIRYYEAKGLIRADRSASGQRLFDSTVLERVRNVRWLISAGLPTRVIKELIDCVDAPGRIEPCAVPTLLQHLDDYDSRIAELAETRDTLQGLIDSAAP